MASDFININGLTILSHEDRGDHYLVQVKGAVEPQQRPECDTMFFHTNAYTESVNSVARFINRIGRGYSFEVLRARLLYNDQALKDSSTSVRKKIRKPRPSQNSFTLGRSMAETDKYEETTTNYGPYIPTLVKLLEEGYFL